jgi:hypothetical protein
MRKVTPAMQGVLNDIENGWILRTSRVWSTRAWLTNTGEGSSTTKRVSLRTFSGLVERGLIEIEWGGYPVRIWKLSQQAMQLLRSENEPRPRRRP